MILFFGSGISYASGGPSVGDIQDALDLTKGSALRTACRDLRVGQEEDPHEDPTDADVRVFLSAVRHVDQALLQQMGFSWSVHSQTYRATGAIYRQAPNYESLFGICEEIADCRYGLSDLTTAVAMLHRIDQFVSRDGPRAPVMARLHRLIALADVAGTLIRRTVLRLLSGLRPKRLELVGRLCNERSFGSTTIITLNHDLLVEKQLASDGIPYVNGFKTGRGAAASFRGFNRIIDTHHPLLLKPHGSIDWWKLSRPDGSTDVLCDAAESRSSLRMVSDSDALPLFLTGTSKPLMYHSGIFAKAAEAVQEALATNDTMIMSGYGWADTAMNWKIQAWLGDHPRRRLILLHPSLDELSAGSLQFAESHSGWLRRGQLVQIPKFLMDVTADEATAAVKS
ncbi:MAG: SIR2 family protein [Planctomycetota bacterium]